MATTCGATWATPLLVKIGDQISTLCPLCNEETDALVHRLYRCRATRGQWSKLPKRWLDFVDDDLLLFCRALGPDIIVPGKVQSYNFVLIGEESHDLSTLTFRSRDGPVCLDGSCFNGSLPIATAGFSLCQTDEQGCLIKAAYAAVPGFLSQTAALAEHAAFMAWTDLTGPEDPVEAIVDCMSVIASYRHGLDYACAWSRVTALAWRAIALRQPDYVNNIFKITHFKAHQDEQKAQDEGVDMRLFHGNHVADSHAKLGARIHALDESLVLGYEARYSKIHRIARHIASTAVLFPTFRQMVQGVPFVKPVASPKPSRDRRQLPKGHSMVWLGHIWRCFLCCRQSSREAGPQGP